MDLKAIDGHIHGDILLYYTKDFPKKYHSMGIGGINWAYNEEITTVEGYIKYWEHLSSITEELRKSIPFFYMVGIHPRTICKDLEETKKLPTILKDSLKKHLTSPLCMGIGEIGLETEGASEENILRAQLEFACSHLPEGKRIGIHTPRHNKEKITEKILRILEDYPSLEDQILIEHMTLSTLSMVTEKQPVVGMTLQEGKTTLQDIQKIVEKGLYPLEKIILNSDGGKRLSLPFLNFVEKDYVDPSNKKRMIKDNLLQFYSITL